MKVKLMILLSGWFVILPVLLRAQKQQVADPSVNNAVMARIAEVAFITGMPVVRQNLLARLLIRKDSLISDAVRSRMDASGMGTLISNLDEEFESFLTTTERQKYYAYTNRRFIQSEAKAVSVYYRNKYKIRPNLESMINGITLAKNDDLNRAFAMGANPNGLRIIESILTKYDSLSGIYMCVAKGEEYLENKIKLLDSIKPLGDNEKSILRNNFYNLSIRKGDDYYTNFRAALPFASKHESYYDLLYKDSLEQEVHQKSELDCKALWYRYGLADSVLRKITPLVYEKNRIDKDYELRMPYNRKRDSLQQLNLAKYDAAVKKVLIRSGYYSLGNNRLVSALRLKRPLQLSNDQIDILVQKNYDLDLMAYEYSQVDPWGEFDGSGFIHNQLEKTLSAGQFDTLLRIESTPQALSIAKLNWADCKKYGLNDIDSATAYNQAFSYHLNRLILTKRYPGNKTLLNKLLMENARAKPQILKRLDAAMKLNDYDAASASQSKY